MEQELVAKYENLGWLKDIEDSKKQELVQLYEYSIALIEKERVINNRIEVLFLPVIARIYKNLNNVNCKQILSVFRTFVFENLEKYQNFHVENIHFDYEAELCAQFADAYVRINTNPL